MADVKDAVDFLRQANDAEADWRQEALLSLQFRFISQWPDYAIASRGLERPQLTINETNTYIKKVCNAQRAQRPRGKASPVDDRADLKIAKTITGLGRHIEVNSDADNAYDGAFEFAATMGKGYISLRTDYISDHSFDQDIFICTEDNPFAIYFDPNSSEPDGSDATRALKTAMMRKEAFRLAYPGAQDSSFQERGRGDSDTEWETEQDIRLAEYYYIDRVRAKLVKLSDGTVVWADQVEKDLALMAQLGLTVVGERESFKTKVRWCKQTAMEVLEEKVIPGRYIPIVPVYWTRVVIDGKVKVRGLVWDAMDPQRMVNFWHTAITETLAMAPKPKWLIAEGQDEDHEKEWAAANISPTPTLHYKPTDVQGNAVPPPQRIAPDQPPAGFIEAAFMASQNLSRVLGVFDPAVRGGAQHKSDKTLNAERAQSEMTNFDGYDNLTRSIKHVWRIMLGWFPTVYDVQRVQRIIGEDGREQMVTLNHKQVDPATGAIVKVLNDVTVGNYDVVMQTGPGYDTKRQEGVAGMIDLMSTPLGEKVAAVADDLIVRQMDFPGADLIADRLAAANPLSKIDEQSDVPPQAQMMIAGLQQKLQQAMKMIQDLEMDRKYRGSIEQMRQQGATQREHLKSVTAVHDTETIAATRAHDVESKAVTAQNVEEIKGLVSLMLKHIDTAQLEREIAARNVEQQIKAAEPHAQLQ